MRARGLHRGRPTAARRGRPRARDTVIRAGEDRGGPRAGTPRGSRHRLEHRVGDAEGEGLRALEHPVLVERVLDDDLERRSGPRSGSAAGRQPPQPGTRPRKHSGRPTAGTPEEIGAVGAVQRRSRGRRPCAAPLTKANDGTGRPRRACRTSRGPAGRSRAPGRAGSPWARRSGRRPTAKMNGLPVTPTPTISPASARACSRSSASPSAASVAGPKVLGLVWSTPLSRVISARARAAGQGDVPHERAGHDLVVGKIAAASQGRWWSLMRRPRSRSRRGAGSPR